MQLHRARDPRSRMLSEVRKTPDPGTLDVRRCEEQGVVYEVCVKGASVMQKGRTGGAYDYTHRQSCGALTLHINLVHGTTVSLHVALAAYRLGQTTVEQFSDSSRRSRYSF